MSEATNKTLKKAYKPFDVVSDENGNVGLIQEVFVNECQDSFDAQISYAVKWLVGDATKHAWYAHCELKLHCNLFVVIAECACHPMSNNSKHVQKLFNKMDR